MAVNPFDRVNLGFAELFGPKGLFYSIPPTSAPVVSLEVPVLDESKTGFVEMGTAIVVLSGFLWICWKLLQVYRAPPNKVKQQERQEKKTK